MERSIGRKPLIAVTLALALVTGTLAGLTTSADAAIPFPDTTRIAATNAIQAGINVSKSLYANGAATSVVLTRNDKFPDGLAASAIAGEFDGPVLFTESSSLNSATETELRRVLPAGRTVFLMGGEAALSRSIANRLDGDYDVRRINGTTRIDTAALAAIRHTRTGPDGTAILVRAYGSPGQDNTEGWVDAISCGGYAAQTGTPILLTNNQESQVAARTLDALSQIQARRVVICGGDAAVPKSHADQLVQLGYAVDRYAGSTRIGTAADVARRLWGYNATTNRNFIIVNGWGDHFAYGIAATPRSAKTDAPILLVNTSTPTEQPTDCPSPANFQAETLCYLMRRGNERIATLTVVGSTSLVNDRVFAAAARAGGLPEDTAPPSVPADVTATDTPQDGGTQVDVAWKASTDDTAGDITYTIYHRAPASGDMTVDNATKAGSVKNATSFRVTGLDEGVEREFAVTATDQFGNTSALSATATVAPTDEAPAAPQSAPNLQNVPDGITVSWLQAPEADVAGYIVERAQPVSSTSLQDPSCDGDQLASPDWQQVGDNITPRSNTAFTDTSVTPGQDYCYRYKVYDTTGNTTDPSPHSRLRAQQVTGDTTAPSAAPSLYAVQYDQQRGSLLGGPSRSNTTSPRVDVRVPAGAFQASEDQGRVKIYNGDSVVTERTFDITGSAQVVSVDTQLGTGDHSLSASLLDLDGNESARSAPWALDVDTPYRSTPRITSVEGVTTDPLTLVDQFIPIVGGDTPFIDPTPRIVIEGLQDRSYVELYVNNTRRVDQNWCPANTGGTGSTPESGGRMVLNATESDDDLIVGPGTSNLVLVTYPCDNDFVGRDTANRSGDSNTVAYVHNNTAFGVISIDPGDGEFDINGYDTFTVEFNRAATADSSLTLLDATGAEVASVTNTTAGGDGNADGKVITFTQAIDPGEYTLRVQASEEGGPGVVDQSATFGSGFAHLVHVDAAHSPSGGYRSATSSGVTLVVEAEAPTGTYRLFSDPNRDANDLVGVVEHEQGARSTAGSSDTAPARSEIEEGGIGGLYWTYRADPSTSQPNPPVVGPQFDGEIPAVLTGSDLQDLGIRQHGNTEFRVDGGPSLDGRGYPFEVWYQPSTTTSGLLGSTTYQTAQPVRVVKTDGTSDPFNNENVQTGWDVRFFVRDDQYGNVGPVAQDGTLRGISSITPTNGLGNSPLPPSKLQPNDTLQIDFGSDVATPSPGPGSTHGGLLLFDGPESDRRPIDPRFGVTGGGQWEIGTPTANALLITFRSQSTYDGSAIGTSGVETTGPTTLHGGSIKRGVNWLVQVVGAGGHVFLLPVADSPATNPGTF